MEEKIYGGTFTIDTKEYSGQIRFLEEKYLVLELHIPEPIIVNNTFNLKNIIIYGTTVTGAKVSLINCSYRNMHSYVSYGKTIVIFMCQFLIWGRYVDKNLKTIYVTLENAVRWSGLSGIEQSNLVEGYFDVIKYKNEKKINFNYGDFNIKLYPSYINKMSGNPIPEKGEICERLVLKIEGK